MTTAAANQPPDLSRFDLQPVKKGAGPDLSRFDLQPVEKGPAGPDLSRFDLQPVSPPAEGPMRAYMPPAEMLSQEETPASDTSYMEPESLAGRLALSAPKGMYSLTAPYTAQPASWLAQKVGAPESIQEALAILAETPELGPSESVAEGIARQGLEIGGMVAGWPVSALGGAGAGGKAATLRLLKRFAPKAGKAAKAAAAVGGTFQGMGAAGLLAEATAPPGEGGVTPGGVAGALVPGVEVGRFAKAVAETPERMVERAYGFEGGESSYDIPAPERAYATVGEATPAVLMGMGMRGGLRRPRRGLEGQQAAATELMRQAQAAQGRRAPPLEPQPGQARPLEPQPQRGQARPPRVAVAAGESAPIARPPRVWQETQKGRQVRLEDVRAALEENIGRKLTAEEGQFLQDEFTKTIAASRVRPHPIPTPEAPTYPTRGKPQKGLAPRAQEIRGHPRQAGPPRDVAKGSKAKGREGVQRPSKAKPEARVREVQEVPKAKVEKPAAELVPKPAPRPGEPIVVTAEAMPAEFPESISLGTGRPASAFPGGARMPRTWLKKFMQTVPEFREKAEFTVEKGKLTFRSFTSSFTVEPKMLGLEPKSLTEGQKVKVDIASFGLKKPTKVDVLEARAMGRIKKRGTRLKAGIDPAELADYAIIGAAKIVKGTVKFADWSKEMVKGYGYRIEPYLVAIYKQSKKLTKTHPDKWAAADYRGKEIAAAAKTPFDEEVPEKQTTAQAATWLAKAKKHLAPVKEYVGRADPRRYVEKVVLPPTVLDSQRPVSPEFLKKFAKDIKTATPARHKTEALRHKERQRRAAIASSIHERGEGEEVMKRSLAAQAGELPIVGFEPIAKKYTQAERDAAQDHIRTHSVLEGKSYEKNSIAQAFRNILDLGALPTQSELAWFNAIFGPEVTRALLKQYGTGAMAGRALREANDLERAHLSSFDMSAPGRQGYILSLTHPVEAGKALAHSVVALGSEKHTAEVARTINKSPFREEMDAVDLFIADTSSSPLSSEGVRVKTGRKIKGKDQYTTRGAKDEFYRSDIPARLARAKLKGWTFWPAFWKVMQLAPRNIHASGRAYSTYLNIMRTRVYELRSAEMKKAGLDWRNDEHFIHFKRFASLLNNGTGRGPKLTKSALTRDGIYSQRLLTSRFVYPVKLARLLADPKTPWPVRKETIRQLATVAGGSLGFAMLINFTGDEGLGLHSAHVELDSRSSDFFKVRVGKTRYDIGAGFGQVIRVFAAIWTDEYKDLRTGRVRSLRDIGKKVTQFIRYKMAPLPSAGWSLVQRQTPDWEDATAGNIAHQLLLPINLQTIYEVGKEYGPDQIWRAIPETGGIGVSVYEREKRP